MKLNKSKRVITLSRADTKTWQDSGSDGDKFRRLVREIAHHLADANGKSVEIYASASAGGWMCDQIEVTS